MFHLAFILTAEMKRLQHIKFYMKLDYKYPCIMYKMLQSQELQIWGRCKPCSYIR